MKRRLFQFLLAFILIVTPASTNQVYAQKAENSSYAVVSSYDDYDDEDYDDDYDYDDEDYDDADYDYDDEDDYEDEEDYDDDEDYDDEDDDIVLYKDVVKHYDSVKLSDNKPVQGSYEELDAGETLVYDFSMSVKAKVVLSFTDDTLGDLAYTICDKTTGKSVFEKSFDFAADVKRYAVSLDAGNYSLKICSKDDSSDVDFHLTLADTSISRTLKGYSKYEADPGLGKGTWKTSNRDVVKISKSSGDSCIFTSCKPGNATVTFKNEYCSVSYKFTVKKITKTISKTLSSGHSYTANPKQGKGSWQSSNEKAVSISSKKADKITIKGKNKGTATITFSNNLAVYKYKIKIK